MVIGITAAMAVSCKPKTSSYTFPQDYTSAFCQKAETCLWAELPNDYDECYDLMLPAVEARRDDCPDFSIGNARDCLEAIRRMSCDDGSLYQDVYQDPIACDNVYNCYSSLGSN